MNRGCSKNRSPGLRTVAVEAAGIADRQRRGRTERIAFNLSDANQGQIALFALPQLGTASVVAEFELGPPAGIVVPHQQPFGIAARRDLHRAADDLKAVVARGLQFQCLPQQQLHRPRFAPQVSHLQATQQTLVTGEKGQSRQQRVRKHLTRRQREFGRPRKDRFGRELPQALQQPPGGLQPGGRLPDDFVQRFRLFPTPRGVDRLGTHPRPQREVKVFVPP